MGAGKLHTKDLDHFVSEIDRFGGPHTSDAAAYLCDFTLAFDTHVDQTLDPFSPEYYQAQLKLYEELSGRTLNQEEGERTEIDVPQHVSGANPYNSKDINFISKHARAVLTAIHMANLPPNASILDMGSGWGLSSEMMAFCGANVTCVDINPLFVKLNQERAARLQLPLRPRLSEFDTYTDDEKYSLVFFYECLHHAVKPWETLEHLSQYVALHGKIAFAGEPINDMFWKNWGLRLDSLSIYCIRKFGWFENGWSKDFLSRAFEKAGFSLYLYPHIGLDNGWVGLATRTSENLNPLDSFNLQVTHPTSNLMNSYNSLQASFRSLNQRISVLDQAEQNHSKRQKLTALVKKALRSLRG